MDLIISDSFLEPLNDQHRYLVLCGGGGSGKSEFAGRKVLYRCRVEGGHKFLILRKVRATLRESVIALTLSILDQNEIEYEYSKSDRIIKVWNNLILFEGLDDREKIKSIKGITSVWMEEATEFTKEDLLQIDLRLREPSPNYKQIMMSFNPDEAQAPWLKDMFFDNTKDDSLVHQSTIEDNPIDEVREQYLTVLENLDDPVYYDIYRLGNWALARGIIYTFPDVANQIPKDPDEVIYGLDFGFNNPTALVKIYIKDNEAYFQELILESKLTNSDLIARMQDLNVNGSPIYADSSEPDRIDEISRAGFNVWPCTKGQDSVRTGIDYVKSIKKYTLPDNAHLNREFKQYKWKEDKSGNALDEPVKYMDHGMDAIRYALYTHFKDRAESGFGAL